MNKHEVAQVLVDRGIGNRWFKNRNLDRLYINRDAMFELAGLVMPTGPNRFQRGGTLNGEPISQELTRKIGRALASTKMYLDLTTGQWHIQLEYLDLEAADTLWKVVDQVFEVVHELEKAQRKRRTLLAR